MAVTIEKFDLLPGAPAAAAPAPAPEQKGEGGEASQQPSRHDVIRILREEHTRRARVSAH
ncbi:Hypothetical protein A7982_02232 [Minicystis rosea]|nr:Hypothetical protein A7982_02232 [Minicystis rosea]